MKGLSLNPLYLFAVAGIGFVAWVAVHAWMPPSAPTARVDPDEEIGDEPDGFSHFGNTLFTVHAGMPQTEVERRLRKQFAAGSAEVDAVDQSAGSALYRMRFRIDLFRPIPGAAEVASFVPGPHIVTLAFDAGRAGHPLTSIDAAPDGNLSDPSVPLATRGSG